MLPAPFVACLVLPLAANDWLEGLIPFLFFLIWIVSQVVGVVRRIGGGGKLPGGGDPNARRPVGPAPGSCWWMKARNLEARCWNDVTALISSPR